MMANISERACDLNVLLALEAQARLLAGVSIWEMNQVLVDRLMVCGRCPRSGITGAKATIQAAFAAVIHKIDVWNEWGADPDRARERNRERQRRWREKHREEIQDRRQEAAIDTRLAKLREGEGKE